MGTLEYYKYDRLIFLIIWWNTPESASSSTTWTRHNWDDKKITEAKKKFWPQRESVRIRNVLLLMLGAPDLRARAQGSEAEWRASRVSQLKQKWPKVRGTGRHKTRGRTHCTERDKEITVSILTLTGERENTSPGNYKPALVQESAWIHTACVCP